jgi:hypothetical protein
VRRVPFSRFARPDSFSAVPRASGHVFMFCAPGLVFGGTEGVGSRFHVFRSRTHFRRFRGRRVPFSCFPRPDSFSAVPMVSGPVFMFCAPGLIFGGSEGVGSCFNVLRAPDSFSAVPRASGPVFMFCAPRLIFGGTEFILYCFHILRARTRFRRFRGRRFPFSCFALLDSFSTVPRASDLVFMFCAPGLISKVKRASGPVFMFCSPKLVFGGAECVGFHFHDLRSRNHFQRCRVRRVPFSCFARPD